MATNETRQFKMHERLLFDVIQRQAGTLAKAILEGVMNSIDARSTWVDIRLNERSVAIRDDGKGFRSREEIEKYFETFGQPHAASEHKVYGTFRMGRGQLMAFGRNSWRTGPFEMSVDIKNKGLDYQLQSNLKKARGCTITIDLYENLGELAMRDITDELIKFVKYVKTPIAVNGEQVNIDPANKTWETETDDAYFKFTTGGELSVYNLGVHVRGYGSHQFGCGGVIVAKQQLKLNFARNDVMADCPVWKRIRKVIEQHSNRAISERKRSLTEGERWRLCTLFSTGQMKPREAVEAPIFRDACGRYHSLARIAQRGAAFARKLTGTSTGDLRGDKLMQFNMAFVLDLDYFEARFRATTARDIVDKLFRPAIKKFEEAGYDLYWNYEIVDFAEISRNIDESYQLVPEKQWTELEKAMLGAVGSAQPTMAQAFDVNPGYRRILLGTSGSASAWTDGKSYIAFDRKFLKELVPGIEGFTELGLVLLHELCHDVASTGTHLHGPEFYEMYHHVSHDSVPEFVAKITGYYSTRIKTAGKRMTRRQLRELDRVGKTTDEAQKIAAMGGR